MPIGTNAEFLAEDALAKWLIETMPAKIQIAQVWPFRGIDGKQLKFARQPVITSTGFAQPIGQNAPVLEQTSSPTDNTTFTLGMLATRYRITYNAMDQNRVPNNLDAVEAALAIRRLLYSYFKMLNDGDAGTPGEFDSLVEICDAGQVVDLGGDTPTLANYEEAYSRVKANNGRPNAIMSNSNQLRQYIGLCHAAGFQPQYVECEWTDPMRGLVRAPIVAMHGTPWYVNDCIEPTGTPLQSNIYFMVLGDANDDPGPQHGITGIIPAPLKDTMFVRREMPVLAVPTAASNDVTVDAVSLINVDYTWPVGLAMGAQGALAILQNAQELSA